MGTLLPPTRAPILKARDFSPARHGSDPSFKGLNGDHPGEVLPTAGHTIGCVILSIPIRTRHRLGGLSNTV